MYRLIFFIIVKIIMIITLLLFSNVDTHLMSSHDSLIYKRIRQPSSYPLLKDIGGIKDIKEHLIANVIIPMKKVDKFFGKTKIKGLPFTRGTLFVGPPGTGKTLLANAVANECNIPLIQVQLADIENKYFGESNKLIKSVFNVAYKIKPCVVFFDEIDGLIRKRNEFDQSCTYGMKTEFLQQLDILQKKEEPIFIVACTNHSSYLDCAMKRRIPAVYDIRLPDFNDRLDILKKYLDKTTDGFENLNYIAENTDDFSGSDLYDLIQTAYSFRFSRRLKEDVTILNAPNPHLGECTLEDWKLAILSKKKIDVKTSRE